MNKERIDMLQDAIEFQNKILMETQHQIRQAQIVIEGNEKEYKKALQEKAHLQDKLISALSERVHDEMLENLKKMGNEKS
jgi:hypothetical protein